MWGKEFSKNPSPHAHLGDYDVTALFKKVGKAKGGDQRKLRGLIRHICGEGPCTLCQPGQGIIGNGGAVYLDPLVKAGDVGGGIEPGFIPGLLKDGGQHGGGGALSVGAGNVDKL